MDDVKYRRSELKLSHIYDTKIGDEKTFRTCSFSREPTPGSIPTRNNSILVLIRWKGSWLDFTQPNEPLFDGRCAVTVQIQHLSHATQET
jgi:hypothetical protein